MEVVIESILITLIFRVITDNFPNLLDLKMCRQKDFVNYIVLHLKKTETYENLCHIPEETLLNYLKTMKLNFNGFDLKLAILLHEIYTFINDFLVVFCQNISQTTEEPEVSTTINEPNCSTIEDVDESRKEDLQTEEPEDTQTEEVSTNGDLNVFTKYGRRKINFAYVTFLIQNKKIEKISIGTFSHIVTINNCPNSWDNHLKYYIKRFKIDTLFVKECKKFNFQMKGVKVKFFKLRKEQNVCSNCKDKDCTSGIISQYFKLFHSVEFNDCDFN